MNTKVLIVGTVPYNKKSTSRAFESYFSNFKKENLAQIFSHTKKPVKGHCGTLFQITDQRLLRKRIDKNIDAGRIYNYEDLEDEWKDTSLEVGSSIIRKLYSWGSKKKPYKYIIRSIIWQEKYWCTDELNEWLTEFNPECIFLSFSDDFFIHEIALYVAEKFGIPIVSSIGDDYYFDSKFSISPMYYLYKYRYRTLVSKLLRSNPNAIYIGDKIRDKYNSYFGINGKTVYLTSTIKCKEYKPINKKAPKITYCGNIRLGRNTSLDDIGNALGEINKEYVLNVYSNECEDKYYRILNENNNIKYNGSISYDKVIEEILSSDIVVIVEGFKVNEVRITKYSLSTKAADSLASGSNILVYGSQECGVIEYMSGLKSATVCFDKENLVECISKLFEDEVYQKRNYLECKKVSRANHDRKESAKIFESVIANAIRKD